MHIHSIQDVWLGVAWSSQQLQASYMVLVMSGRQFKLVVWLSKRVTHLDTLLTLLAWFTYLAAHALLPPTVIYIFRCNQDGSPYQV